MLVTSDPAGFVTRIVPVPAPDGTRVRICTSESTVNEAGRPLNRTEVVPVNPLPVIVTTRRNGPDFRLKSLREPH